MAFIWKCNKCGYTIKIEDREELHNYVEPGGRCPRCGAPHEEFKLLYSRKAIPA